ncbi:MAG TPA: four helix bundle protein [Terriglobales bacterium]|nr:four helix bundle protein [Terriglobales bacterium]
MQPARDYRDLRVWQSAMELTESVYALAKLLPGEEKFALSDQLRRAAVSIPANIAEGQARGHIREFLRYACMARGSLAELETLVQLVARLNYATAPQIQPLQDRLDELRRALDGLTSALRRKLSPAA